MEKLDFPTFKLYPPEKTKEIRTIFGDSRPRFAKRLLLESFETIKVWESKKNPVGPTGPANMIMQQLEIQAMKIKEEKRRVLRSIRKR